MLSKKCSTFVRDWYDNYKSLEDKVWNWHSVKLPLYMARKDRRDVMITDKIMVTWIDNTMFERPSHGKSYKEFYCKHLFIRDKQQAHLDLNSVLDDDSDYGRVCKQILQNERIT
jgi:hypothetical protein